MKFKLLSGLLIGGLLLVGCSPNEDETPQATAHAATMDVDSNEGQFVKVDPLDQFQIEATEYLSLESYLEEMGTILDPDSEYLSFQDKETAIFTLANAALHYVNYFEEEIAYHGLTEEMEAYQHIAYEVFLAEMDEVYDEAKIKEAHAKFEESMEKISTLL